MAPQSCAAEDSIFDMGVAGLARATAELVSTALAAIAAA
jgi:hypothetical protein